MHSHGSVSVRRKQFEFVESEGAVSLSVSMIVGKVRGQYAVLKYFSKYKKLADREQYRILTDGAERIAEIVALISKESFKRENWKEQLMGYEGSAARIYWKTIVESGLFPESFKGRKGRGARDIVNSALNYGYAILSTVITNAIINAGLEMYVGVLHSSVPGKPALLLDVMEEYRAVVVDRSIVKLRSLMFGRQELDPALKKRIVEEIYRSINRRHPYCGRKIKLESIIQRQVYRLGALFCGRRNYKPLSHRW